MSAHAVDFRNPGDIVRLMKKINVDPRGIEIMVPKAIHTCIYIEGMDHNQANILKQEMLAVGGDVATPRKAMLGQEGDLSVLLMATHQQYRRVFNKLEEQPFGLSKLVPEIESILNFREGGERLHKVVAHKPAVPEKTLIMGILNITPDSFSDGGRYNSVEGAIQRAQDMVKEGADIIDVGGESTRPGSEPIPAEMEINRVVPAIKRLSNTINVPISIDTYKPEVARAALDAGASIVNDIYALQKEGMAEIVAQSGVPVILMHMKGTPEKMQESPEYDDVISEIYSFFEERISFAMERGITKEQIIIDPGLGFGKRLEDNLEIMNRLEEFCSLGVPILIGPSRKSFIGQLLDLPADDRVEGTIGASVLSASKGANMVRVHDVKPVKRALAVADAIRLK